VDDDQIKALQLIALCDKDQPLSASDVAAIHQLLGESSVTVCGLGKSKLESAPLFVSGVGTSFFVILV
jgi:hypothetical protein